MSKKFTPSLSLRSKLLNAFLILGLIGCLLSTEGNAAYITGRPIPTGAINQAYLWGDEMQVDDDTYYHKGIDIPSSIGTYVTASADGVVVDIEEGLGDNDHTTTWGNYVVIRHNQPDWDRGTGSNAYVYSMYLHLKQNSVIPALNSSVEADDPIARSANSGNSFGPHLHYQVVLHPQLVSTLDNLESGLRSRNPELWLRPLSGKSTAIGKVTDNNGNAAGDLVICGIQKSTPGYVSSRTYSFTWANPDDVLFENFGTTDVEPGMYNVYADPIDSGCGTAQPLGEYTFVAGKVTYVGLYPAWIPYMRSGATSWDSSVYVRNNADIKRSVVNTTFFDTRKITSQTADQSISAQGSIVAGIVPADVRAALAVPSEDSTMLMVATYNGQPAGYLGLTADNGKGSTGWERAGTTLYAPLIKRNYNGRSSQIHILNAGQNDTTVTVTYYDSLGTAFPSNGIVLAPYDYMNSSPPTASGIYSAKITSDSVQPLAAVVQEGDGSGTPGPKPAMYTAYSEGASVLYASMVKKNYNGATSGINLQNTVGGGNVSCSASYYSMNGTNLGTAPLIIPPLRSYNIYDPPQVPNGFLGSVTIQCPTGTKLVGQVSESNGDLKLMSNLALAGTTTVHVPLWYDNYTTGGVDWRTGCNVRNVGTGSNDISIMLFEQNGTIRTAATATLINSNDSHNFYDLPITGFMGSAVIRSNNVPLEPIVAVCNSRNYAGTGDTAFAFNGSNR